jgi:hypothetical protein
MLKINTVTANILLHFFKKIRMNCCGLTASHYTFVANLRWRFSVDSEIFRNTVLPVAAVLTYLPTPWSRVLLEKVAVSQLFKKFPTYFGTRILPRVQKPANRPFSKPCSPCHLLKIHFNIIHHLRLGIINGLLPSGLPTKTMHALRLSPYKPHVQHISFLLI